MSIVNNSIYLFKLFMNKFFFTIFHFYSINELEEFILNLGEKGSNQMRIEIQFNSRHILISNIAAIG